MKLAAVLMLICCLLTGCSSKDDPLGKAMDLRKQILEAQICKFDAVINANYDEEIYVFKISCTADSTGNMDFIVTEPESICGITGSISETGGSLTFDDAVLAFPMLADGNVSPVTAPWLFLKTLRSGYLSGCAEADDSLQISMDDSFEEYPLHIEVTTDSKSLPISAQIYWQQRCVISLDIQNFSLQ